MEASNLNIIIAFLSGLTSFFSPCLLPLLPSYFSMVTGFTFKELYGLNFNKIRRRVFLTSVFFVLGFALVYSLFGATGTIIGRFLHAQLEVLLRFIGLFLFFLGLVQLGIINFDFLRFDYAWRIQKKVANLGLITAFVNGAVFALVWIPCIGQVLAPILLLAAKSETAQRGIILLFIFSLGLATPFLLLGLFFPTIFDFLRSYRYLFRLLSFSAGVLLILFGAILLSNQYQGFIDIFLKLSSLFIRKER